MKAIIAPMVVRKELIKLFPSVLSSGLASFHFLVKKQLSVAKCSNHIHSASNLSP